MNAASPGHRANVLSLSDGLRLLREARDCALEIKRDPWQFAVEIATLHRAGLTNTDLRWLLCCELAQQAAETTSRTDTHRRFTKLRSLALADSHCFVLTVAGCRFMDSQTVNDDQPLEGSARPSNAQPAPVGSDSPIVETRDDKGSDRLPDPDMPVWHPDLHELSFGGRLIKRYVRPAPAQELILSVFQEDGWPPAIDDPLPAKSCQDPKRRLHYTVQNLNRGQKPRRLHFFINGNGQVVRWRPATASRRRR